MIGGRRPVEQDDVGPDEPDDIEPSDEAKMEWRHRYRVALRVGFSDPDACLFADAAIDSHALTDLIDQGCDPGMALRILL